MDERLREQTSLSVRETKRILTIWHIYISVLIRLDQRGTLVESACHLVILAEIITTERTSPPWPPNSPDAVGG